MIHIDSRFLDSLTSLATGNPRLRQHHNLHESYDDPCQRLFNAMEPGSYIRPHRHLSHPKTELFLAIRGKMVLFTFSDDGSIASMTPLAPAGPQVGAEVPPGVWHAVIALEPGSVFFEAKPGPYIPLVGKDFAPWAPEEGSPEAAAYLAGLVTAAGSWERGAGS